MTDYEIEQSYQDMLDDCYGDVLIGGLTYSTSVALQRVDPIAYRIGLSEYADALAEDAEA